MLARIRLATAALVLAFAGAACTQDGARPTAEGSPSLPRVERASEALEFADEASGIRFRLPSPETSVSAEHFDAALPPNKFRHSLRVTALGTLLVGIDVWDNPQGLPLQAWFDRNMAFLVTAGASAEHRLVGKSKVDGIVVDQPRSPQSEARRIVVLATGRRVVRMTCFDTADRRSAETFDAVLSGMEVAP